MRIKTTFEPDTPMTVAGPADNVPVKGEPSDIVTETAVTTVPAGEVSARLMTAGLNVIFVGTGKEGGGDGGGGGGGDGGVVSARAFSGAVKLLIVMVMISPRPPASRKASDGRSSGARISGTLSDNDHDNLLSYYKIVKYERPTAKRLTAF